MTKNVKVFVHHDIRASTIIPMIATGNTPVTVRMNIRAKIQINALAFHGSTQHN